MRRYSILVLFIIISVHVYGQGRTPVFSWTTMLNRLPEWDIAAVDGGIVLFPERVGLFGGRSPDSLEPFLSRSKFGRVEGRTTVKALRNGALLVSGAPDIGYYVRESGRDTLRWLRYDTLGGPLPDVLRHPVTGIRSFEPGAFHAYHAYSVDSGSTWTRVMPPDSVSGWGTIAYGRDQGFFARDMERRTWYALDLVAHRWDTTDIPSDINDVVFMKNGAMVAIGEMPTYHSRLYMRASGLAPLVEIDKFVRADGDTVFVDQLSSDFEGLLSGWNDSTVVVGFSYGVIAILNGRSMTVHSVPEAYTSRLVTMSRSGSDTLLLSYLDGFVVFDVRTGEHTVVRYPPIALNWGNSVVYNNTIIVHDNTRSGMLLIYDLAGRTWSLRGRAVHDGMTVDPADARSIVAHRGKILAWIGEFAAIECDTIPLLLPAVSALSAEPLPPDFETTYGAMRFVPTEHGLLHLGGRMLSLITEDTVNIQSGRTAACAYWEHPERLWIGERKVFMSTDSGKVWAEMNSRDGLDEDSSIVSSIIAVSGTSLIIGRRGYVWTDVAGRTDTVRGGILLSEDQGTTWSKVALPVEGDWVECIVRGSGHCLFAWATEMKRHSGATGTEYRHEAWNLLRSCDEGRTWSVVLTRSFNGILMRPGSWRIASFDATMAVSVADRIFMSKDGGDTWAEQYDFPLNVWYTSMAYDDAGSLWIGSDKGIYRIQPTVSVNDTPDLRGGEEPSITLSPNPSTETIQLNVPAESLPVSMLWIVDERGRIITDLTKDVQCLSLEGDGMRVDISRLGSGTYFFVLHHGAAVSALGFVKR